LRRVYALLRTIAGARTQLIWGAPEHNQRHEHSYRLCCAQEQDGRQ